MTTKKTLGVVAIGAVAAMGVVGSASTELPKLSPTAPTATIAPSPGINILPTIPLAFSGAGASDVAKRKHPRLAPSSGDVVLVSGRADR